MKTPTVSDIDQALSHMGKRLARARLLKQITQEEMGLICGVSRRAIQRMEAGRNVAISTWFTAAARLGYLSDLTGVLEQDKPTGMDQFLAIAKGTIERGRRARR
jgi:transcriptional regulator with XRE-family HTH domain